ncbi:MAG: phytoene desaturase family protein [Flavobacterium sp.]|nr:phytoene desaturase family protein [Flavobacterium sp.]
MQQKSVIIIGAGFAGLSAASFMAKAGYKVTVLEKHNMAGGRARQYKAQGFTFDMGPSWYWMPDVFERFFAQFGKKVADYYQLKRLDPSYSVYWQNGKMDVPANYDDLKKLFNNIEPNSGVALDKFLAEAEYKYKVGINKLVHKPGRKLSEFIDWDLMSGVFKLDVFNSMKDHVAKHFKHPQLRELLEFPVLFLGALPKKTPALYSLMNYADIKGGTWYPEKGMYQIVQAMYHLAKELGVDFQFNQNVEEIVVENGVAVGIKTIDHRPLLTVDRRPSTANQNFFTADVIIAGADYHHVESKLLASCYRSYSNDYWYKRVMAPSCLLYYVGLSKKIDNIEHHTLFFDTSFDVHGAEIYTTKQWPSNPLFYVSAVSVTDPSSAPEGCENLFILIPVATGLTGDDEALREKYFDMVVERMEQKLQQSIKPFVIYKKSFAQSNFIEDYNAFKGNAYGLANTLLQTAILKPSCKSKKVKNLFYTGQLTVPGPGVPPSLISGEVVAKQVLKEFGR